MSEREIDNGSYAYMRKVREEHLTELERAKEFDRGYRAGQRAMDAERMKVMCELRKLNDENFNSYQFMGDLLSAIDPDWISKANMYDDATLNEYMRDRLIHLLGGNSFEGGNDGDGRQCCGSCAAGGDTDVDEPTEIRAVSNEIADMLSRQGKVKFPPNEDGSLDSLKTVEETAALIDDVKRRANQSHESIDRICQQQEAVLQETIEQLRRQMDQQRAMLTEQRDEARAKVIALCNERDWLQKRLDDMREQREHWADEATKMYRLFFSHDEHCVPDNPSEMVAVAVRTLQAKLDKANGENKGLRLSIDEQKESIAQRKKTIRKLTRDNEKVWKTVHELQNERDYLTAALDDMQADPANDRICKLERERDELQAKLDGIAGLLDG